MWYLIREAPKEHEERKVGRINEDRCENVIHVLLEEARESVTESVCIPVFKNMEQAAVKDLFTAGGNELHNEKVFRLVSSQCFTQGLVRDFM